MAVTFIMYSNQISKSPDMDFIKPKQKLFSIQGSIIDLINHITLKIIGRQKAQIFDGPMD